ncbi:MAG TPA: DUF2802 domain-containing protein [Gammaproteobacteria bacterium]|nr:DUF2802 domain-containing protein [Gammaproteobacteria bacterium]
MTIQNLFETLLQTLPWPQILLGLAAALSVLVIYDVAYVWPLCRRQAALDARCVKLEQALAGLIGIAERVGSLENRGREDLSQLAQRLGQLELAVESRSYEQAIGCAERGEEAERLISCFGLTEGEANLVTLLHGERARRPEPRPLERQRA